MSSLADLPEVIGFFSYSREDDEAFRGTLSALRDAIQRELGAQLGRSKRSFRLWQDQEAIAPGKLWEAEIKNAVEQSAFFIPNVTPRAVNSDYCHFEFEAFLARECAQGRTDLVFPILYISVPALENDAQWRNHPVLSIIGQRQYVDWRQFRHHDVHTTAVREAVEHFCQKIVAALNQPLVSPEERRRLEAEAQERLDSELRRQKAEEQQRAEAEMLLQKRQAAQLRAAEENSRQTAEAQRRSRLDASLKGAVAKALQDDDEHTSFVSTPTRLPRSAKQDKRVQETLADVFASVDRAQTSKSSGLWEAWRPAVINWGPLIVPLALLILAALLVVQRLP